MNIAQLQRLRTSALGDDKQRALPQPLGTDEDEKAGFGNVLKEAITEVDQSQKAADVQITSFVSGEQENLHEVMISMNQAQISFQLMTEVRNKMMETYQELMRMQV